VHKQDGSNGKPILFLQSSKKVKCRLLMSSSQLKNINNCTETKILRNTCHNDLYPN